MSRSQPTLTLKLPGEIYERVRRAAKGMNKPVEQALVSIVSAATPSLENVPLEYRSELEAMEDLEDQTLWKEAETSAPPAKQRRLGSLLRKSNQGSLSDNERQELTRLRAQADRRMLRRSYAYLLLKYRGHRIPGLADLKR